MTHTNLRPTEFPRSLCLYCQPCDLDSLDPGWVHRAYLPKLVPDVVLTHRESGDVVILDTKFTAGVLSKGQWGGLTFSRDHLFQIYAYVRSQEHLSANHQTAAGILLYPTVDHSVSETVVVQGHRIC